MTVRHSYRNRFLAAVGGVCLVLLATYSIGLESAMKGKIPVSRVKADVHKKPRNESERGDVTLPYNSCNGMHATPVAAKRFESPINCSKELTGKFMMKRRSCAAYQELLQACPSKGRYGRTPLENFYLSLANEVTDMVNFSRDYREANMAFVHLPKSGGTSVEKVLARAPELKHRSKMDGCQLSHCRQFYQTARTHYNYLDGRALYYSKRSYGIHNYAFPDRPFIYITWFRHPVERIVSTYYYLKKHRCFGHVVCKIILLPSRSLQEFLKKTADCRQSLQDIDNFTVRLLLFDEFPEVSSAFEDCCGSAPYFSQIPAIEEKHYLQAKENLERRMAFVGVLEDWKTSQDMLTRMLNIEDVNSEVHVNANSHRTHLSEYELKEIERRNQWDLKLYEDALRIYEKQKEIYTNLKDRSIL